MLPGPYNYKIISKVEKQDIIFHNHLSTTLKSLSAALPSDVGDIVTIFKIHCIRITCKILIKLYMYYMWTKNYT